MDYLAVFSSRDGRSIETVGSHCETFLVVDATLTDRLELDRNSPLKVACRIRELLSSGDSLTFPTKEEVDRRFLDGDGVSYYPVNPGYQSVLRGQTAVNPEARFGEQEQPVLKDVTDQIRFS